MALIRRTRGTRGQSGTGSTNSHSWTQSKEIARTNAAITSWIIVSILFWFWFLQLLFWIISIGGITAESIPLLGWVLPGQVTFEVAAFLGISLGALFMTIAVTIYKFRGVDCFGGWKDLIFAVLFAFSLHPLLFFIPWVFLYCFAVTVLQTGAAKSEE